MAAHFFGVRAGDWGVGGQSEDTLRSRTAVDMKAHRLCNTHTNTMRLSG